MEHIMFLIVASDSWLNLFIYVNPQIKNKNKTVITWSFLCSILPGAMRMHVVLGLEKAAILGHACDFGNTREFILNSLFRITISGSTLEQMWNLRVYLNIINF